MKPAIDHVVINVQDRLDAARDTFRRLGFTLTERGHHTLGSSNHLAMFGTDYLELLGWEPGGGAARPELSAQPAGLGGLVFKPPPGLDAPPGLAAHGMAAMTRDFSRPVAVAGGVRDARFRTVTLDAAEASYGRVYFCRHFTPELVWRTEWQAHANAVTAVAEFVIATPDPARTARLYTRLFGEDTLAPVAGGMRLECASGATVLLLDWATALRRFSDALAPGAVATDRMVALTFRTASLAATQAALAEGVVAMIEQDGRLVVSAAAACGVALGFVE